MSPPTHTRYGLGLFELDKTATGGRTVCGVAGGYWGHMFCSLLFKIPEAELGITIGA